MARAHVPLVAVVERDSGGERGRLVGVVTAAALMRHFLNVVVLGIAERNRHPISFWEFTKYGLVVTAATVALSALYLWLRYFALA
ncbi:hypothetical protein Snoj_42250 [Streptomyces nojiriensis]|uniref:Uncharacterized protein n=1 Tax=Streptomyces nojiriensis TaxID=66374 RepID=A0ABQ3SQU1_9ACTN|nr:hypothetical protein [Streptomyces nojiriensis]QTI43842.1 putative transporter [Streptomyces nojiriensis]GGR84121.1 hypothetical protein GCM10010205_10910 [Streptomyces nojiriensis]GHI70307.1 hypothetical protein Snoj_42250 [Streptomyces nojiriensis]